MVCTTLAPQRELKRGPDGTTPEARCFAYRAWQKRSFKFKELLEAELGITCVSGAGGAATAAAESAESAAAGAKEAV